MRLALLGVVSLAVSLAIAGSSSAAGSAGSYSCKVKHFKVDGYPAVTGCGPATATLTVSGRTYSFKNGLCSISGGTASTRVLHLDLGTRVQVPNPGNTEPKVENDGYPFFTITTLGGTLANVNADYHGKLITGMPGPSSFKYQGRYAGSFTSHSAVKFSGSWNCHGVSVEP